MDVLNMNTHAVPVRLRMQGGAIDYVTVQARRRVSLTDGAVVDTNWLAVTPRIKTFASPTSKDVLPLIQATVPSVTPSPATVVSAPAPVPASE